MKAVAVCATLLSGAPTAWGEGRRYHAHDKVAIVANTVGPFNNPTETYPVKTRSLLRAGSCVLLLPCVSHPPSDVP